MILSTENDSTFLKLEPESHQMVVKNHGFTDSFLVLSGCSSQTASIIPPKRRLIGVMRRLRESVRINSVFWLKTKPISFHKNNIFSLHTAQVTDARNWFWDLIVYKRNISDLEAIHSKAFADLFEDKKQLWHMCIASNEWVLWRR